MNRQHQREIIEQLVVILQSCRNFPIVILYGPEGSDEFAYVQGREIAANNDDPKEMISAMLAGERRTRVYFGINDPEIAAERVRTLRDALAGYPVTAEGVKAVFDAMDRRIASLLENPQGNA